MKITLLEPLGIPAQVLEQYKARLEAKGHSFTAYGDKTTDPAELIRGTATSPSSPTIPIPPRWWKLRST